MGIGEVLVDVMLQVIRALDPVGLEQRQRRQGNDVIEPAPAGRVAVNRLMLQRGVQADNCAAQRQYQPPRQVTIEPGERREGSADGDRQQHGRPVDADARNRMGLHCGRGLLGHRDQLRQLQGQLIRLCLQPALILDGQPASVEHGRLLSRCQKGAPAPWRSGSWSTVPPRSPGPVALTTRQEGRAQGARHAATRTAPPTYVSVRSIRFAFECESGRAERTAQSHD